MKVRRVAKQLLPLLNSTCHERVKLSVSGGEILAQQRRLLPHLDPAYGNLCGEENTQGSNAHLNKCSCDFLTRSGL